MAMRDLPSLRALMMLRALGEHGRMVDAAASLGVTESAVSHQLRQLEDRLRVRLVDRGAGPLTLTDEGLRYLARIGPALSEIEAATAALQPGDGRKTVRLTLPPSFAATWLIPRLPRFEAAHPEIGLDLVLTTQPLDLARERIELAIRYGRGPWPGLVSRHLLDDRATPVAAPGRLPEPPPPLGPDPLPAGLRLLVNRAIPAEWEEWARARGVAPPALDEALWFDTQEQVVQVAEAGHGLALGRTPYIDARLAEGRLVAPYGAAGPTGAAYYLCHAEGVAPVAAALRLADWLLSEAQT